MLVRHVLGPLAFDEGQEKAEDLMKQINDHSVVGLIKMKVTYGKKP